MTGKERLINTLKGLATDSPPIWLMRQAGRYLPEYQAVRAQFERFQDLYTNPKVAVQLALQPLDRFDLDAGIVFADILTLVESVGLPVSFEKNIGPVIHSPIRSSKDVQQLHAMSSYSDCVYESISLLKTKRPHHGLIGFAGAPWTLATYMVEGKISKDLHAIKKFKHTDPKALHALLSHLTEALIHFLKAQARAGADLLVLFDTWGGTLSQEEYVIWSQHYIQKIIQAIDPIPLFVFTKNSAHLVDHILHMQPKGMCIDWTTPLVDTYLKTNTRGICLQGNFDPSMLFGSEDAISESVNQTVAKLPSHHHLIPSLGHGITPHIQPDKVAYFIQSIRQAFQTHSKKN